MAETIQVKKQAILDLVKVKDKFDAIIDSLELMRDKEFMASFKQAKDQFKERDFADWNGL